MVFPQIAGGGYGLQVWMVALDMLHEQSCATDKE